MKVDEERDTANNSELFSTANVTAPKHGVILDYIRTRMPLCVAGFSRESGSSGFIFLLMIGSVILLVFLVMLCLRSPGNDKVERESLAALPAAQAAPQPWWMGRTGQPPQQPTSASPSVIQGLLRPAGGGHSAGIATPLSWVHSEARHSAFHGKAPTGAMSVAHTDAHDSSIMMPGVPSGLLSTVANRKHLCPGLVVPENNECTLILPEINGPPNGHGTLSIDNLNGVVVIHATYTLSPALLTGQGEKRLELKSAVDNKVLVSCRDTTERDANGNPTGLIILNRSEEASGILKANTQSSKRDYMVVLTDGQKVLLRRDLQRRPYATDENSWLLACTEDSERGRVVRISPQVDAGLMTLAMLGTDILELRATAG